MRMVHGKAAGQAFVVVAYLIALGAALATGRAMAPAHPLLITACADGVATAVVFAFSVVLDNSSVYDPYWSVAPPAIAAYWASVAPTGALSSRQVVILALVVLWALRLTANWARRWGGPADEDFRYREIRAKTGRTYWPVSLLSIHVLPTTWVFLGLVPIYPALTRGGSMGGLDLVAATVTFAAIAIETIADRQLRAFVRSPHAPDAILDSGLWRLCRHPNYLGEVLFWWGLFLFGLAAQPTYAWSIVGPLSITALFVFVSVPWMDRHLLARRPAWAERMQRVPALLPGLHPRERAHAKRGRA